VAVLVNVRDIGKVGEGESDELCVILLRLGCYPDAILGIRIAAKRQVAKIIGCVAATVELLNWGCTGKLAQWRWSDQLQTLSPPLNLKV
jgi:hypothetical protein